jgi:hypothetical protein
MEDTKGMLSNFEVDDALMRLKVPNETLLLGTVSTTNPVAFVIGKSWTIIHEELDLMGRKMIFIPMIATGKTND